MNKATLLFAFVCLLISWCHANRDSFRSVSKGQFARRSEMSSTNSSPPASGFGIIRRQRSPPHVFVRGGSSPRMAPRTLRRPWQSSSSTTTTRTSQFQTDSKRVAKETMDAFLTRDSRNTFIARVYAILAGQLLVTAGSIYMFGTNDWASQLIRKPGKLGAAVPAVSLLLSTVSWFVMAEWPTARRASPLKWQLLTLFTLGESIAAGFLTSFFKFPSVVTAMMATVVAVVSIAVYTITQPDSRYDLSQWGAGLTSAGLIFLFLGLIQLLEVCGVLPKGFLPITEKAYCFFGATLFTIYLAHHTRMVVAGKHTKYQMNEKDYVFGALTLYNDIISLFTYLLRILGEDRE